MWNFVASIFCAAKFFHHVNTNAILAVHIIVVFHFISEIICSLMSRQGRLYTNFWGQWLRIWIILMPLRSWILHSAMKTHILPNVKFNLRKLLMTYLYQDNMILFLVRRFLSFTLGIQSNFLGGAKGRSGSGIITYADQDQA